MTRSAATEPSLQTTDATRAEPCSASMRMPQRISTPWSRCAPAKKSATTGPLTRRYSNAAEHEYSPELRGTLLAEAEERHRSEIDSALAMLAKAAETAPLLRKALDRAQKLAGPES